MTNESLTEPLTALLAGQLTDADATAWLSQLTPEQATFEQFAMLINTVRTLAIPLPEIAGDILDCCGTGGSGRPHFNVSTTVAFVLAAGGVRVVKFGNRAATSASGSFDLLERLGVPVEFPLTQLSALLDATNLAFLYAPQCYPALKSVAAVRRQFGRPTLFNYIGPLLHPLHPTRRLMGVSHARMQAFAAQWLAQDAQTKRALVVRGAQERDELTPAGTSVIYNVTPRHIIKYPWAGPELATDAAEDLPGTPEANLTRFWQVVNGQDTTSSAYHSVRLNAGLGFVAAGHVATPDDGAAHAVELLATGQVKRCVQAFLAHIQR